jgi:SAM-dependent methyltransferase
MRPVWHLIHHTVPMTSRDLASNAHAARRRIAAAVGALRGRPAPGWRLDVPDQHGWWDLLPFTTHRIPLAPGLESAVVGVEPFDDVRTDLVVEACGGSLVGRSVVDLGCLEGGFSLAFADRGAERVVGIEARSVSVERCRLAAVLRGETTVEFVEADIKEELGRREPFDVVFAAGILYHVADPAGLLRAIRASCTAVAVIDTHVADVAAPSHGCSSVTEVSLGGRQYRGRMFPEYDPGVSAAEKSDLLWAAWSDVDSFWPLEDDLVRMIGDAGFGSIEKVDLVADGRANRWGVDQVNRVVYVARV